MAAKTSSYSTDADLVLLLHDIATNPGYATGSDFSGERNKASGWVDDNLKDKYDVPFATADLTDSIVQAEANYAVGSILRAYAVTVSSVITVQQFADYNPFFQEAKALITKIRSFGLDPNNPKKINKLQSTTTGVEPIMAKSKLNRDGDRINPSLAVRKLDGF